MVEQLCVQRSGRYRSGKPGFQDGCTLARSARPACSLLHPNAYQLTCALAPPACATGKFAHIHGVRSPHAMALLSAALQVVSMLQVAGDLVQELPMVGSTALVRPAAHFCGLRAALAPRPCDSWRGEGSMLEREIFVCLCAW